MLIDKSLVYTSQGLKYPVVFRPYSYQDMIVKEKVFTKDEVISILEELQVEIEELEPPKSYSNDYTNAYLGAIAMKEKDKCIIQSKIDKLKSEERG